MDATSSNGDSKQAILKLLSEKEVREIKKVIDTPIDNLLDVYKICLQMQQISESEQGIGIAAIQVGVPWRLFLIKIDGSYRYFLNCDYKPIDNDKLISVEGCLTLRDNDRGFRQFQLERYKKVRVIGNQLLIPELKLINIDEEFSADSYGVVFQHEIDHCNLVLINDIGKEVFFWRT